MVAESANFWISRKKTSIWKNSISMSSPAKLKTNFEKFRFQGKEKPQKHKVSEVLYAFSRSKRLSLCEQKLSLAELRCSTSCFETVFLTFFHTWVTSKESSSFKNWSVFSVCLKKGSCNTMSDGTSLSCVSAAC